MAPIAVLRVYIVFLIRTWPWLNNPKHVAYLILLCMLCATVLSTKIISEIHISVFSDGLRVFRETVTSCSEN